MRTECETELSLSLKGALIVQILIGIETSILHDEVLASLADRTGAFLKNLLDTFLQTSCFLVIAIILSHRRRRRCRVIFQCL